MFGIVLSCRLLNWSPVCIVTSSHLVVRAQHHLTTRHWLSDQTQPTKHKFWSQHNIFGVANLSLHYKWSSRLFALTRMVVCICDIVGFSGLFDRIMVCHSPFREVNVTITGRKISIHVMQYSLIKRVRNWRPILHISTVNVAAVVGRRQNFFRFD